MNGLSQLPELPTDATTATTATPSDPTATPRDGGAFDQLVASVASVPGRGSATPQHDENQAHAHETQPTTPTAAANTLVPVSATHAIMLLAANEHSTTHPTAHKSEHNDRSDPHTAGGNADGLSPASGANSLLSVSTDTQRDQRAAGTSGDTTLAISGKSSAKYNTENTHSTRSNISDSPSADVARASGNSTTQSAQEISLSKTQPDHLGAINEMASHRSTNVDRTAQPATDSSRTNHESRAESTAPEVTQAADSIGPNLGTAPIGATLASARQNPGHTGELPGVASQLLNVISPLRQTPAGGQTLTIALHPAGLGEVRVSLTVSEGQTTVRLIASTPEGANAIRGSLGSLESGLSDGRQQAHVFLGNELSGSEQQNSSEGRATDGHRQSSTSDSSPTSPAHSEIDRSATTDNVSNQSTTRLINMRI